jgi:tetratricopeptide (TPR) repeat protein
MTRQGVRVAGARVVALAATGLALVMAIGCGARSAPVVAPNAAPRFPEFIYPDVPAALAAPPAVADQHEEGWHALQSGDFRAAEHSFAAALKASPSFYPAEAGLGYLGYARKDFKNAIAHFDRAVASNPVYVPALVGRGEAALEAGDSRLALASFEAAVAADPGQAPLKPRIEALRFRGLQDDVALARKAAEAGRFDEASAAYQRAIDASPQSAFLYRELAAAERRQGNLEGALAHALKASEMEPAEPRSLILAGEIYDAQGDYAKAADAYGAAVAIEPNEAVELRLDDLRKKAAFAAMPAEYQSIETSPTVTRGQLAALLGVRLDELLKRTRKVTPGVITDTRSHWAAPWILSVARAGVMEPYANHTFQPDTTVRRGDLATAVSRALSLIAVERPAAAAAWRNAGRRFPDVSPGHLSYPAVSLAVESGVMTTAEDGSFQLSRPVTGSEAVAAVKKLESLAERRTP